MTASLTVRLPSPLTIHSCYLDNSNITWTPIYSVRLMTSLRYKFPNWTQPN